MTQSELEDLLAATLAAAYPDATTTEVAKFAVAWAKYKTAYPDDGDQPLLKAAELCGFKIVSGTPPGPDTLHHVIAALQVAHDKRLTKNRKGGGQRSR